MLTYYIGQYLLPALTGKIFGLRVADITMGLLGIFGMMLLGVNIISITKAEKLWQQIVVILSVVLFSGMLHPLQHTLALLFPQEMVYPNTDISSVGCMWGIYIDNYHFEYRSFFTIWQWVHQQAIIPWLCAILFWINKHDYKYLAFLLLPAYIAGTWAFLGLVVIESMWVVWQLIAQKGKCWKAIVSWENIFCILFPGVLISLYFLGNVTGEKPEGMSFGFDLTLKHSIYWLIFCVFMFGIYAVIIARQYKRDPIFWFMLAELIVIPLSSHTDFVMCTSIPALLFLLLYILNFLFAEERPLIARKVVLTICLLIASYTPLIQIRKAAVHVPYDRFYEISLEDNTERNNPKINNAMKYQYYTYNPDDSLFYKYIARK